MYLPPSHTVTLSRPGSTTIQMAIWPDADGASETHTLNIKGSSGAATSVPIHVLDQDLGTPITYPVTVDFSHDAALPDGTHFFLDDPAKQAIFRQTVTDWAYFFDGTGLDPVAAGSETTPIDGAAGMVRPARSSVQNTADYTGFLFYGTGIHTTDDRSTGYPNYSSTLYETRGGDRDLPARSSRSEEECRGRGEWQLQRRRMVRR